MTKAPGRIPTGFSPDSHRILTVSDSIPTGSLPLGRAEWESAGIPKEKSTMTPPTLPARRSVSGADLIVDCDHCQGPHFHGRHNPFSGCTYPHADRCTCPTGTGDGHRRPHCHDRTSPYAARGYVLEEKGALDA